MVTEPMDAFEQHPVTEDAIAETGSFGLPLRDAVSEAPGGDARRHAGSTRDAQRRSSDTTTGGRRRASDYAPEPQRRRSMGLTDDTADTGSPHRFQTPPQPAFARLQPAGDRLALAIEAAIVPRLVMAHGVASDAAQRSADPSLEAAVPALVALLLEDDADAAMALLLRLRTGGAGIDAVCLDLLAPAARRLGTLWAEDDCDFATVTVAVARLRRAMHVLGPRSAAHPVVDAGRVALLAASPGEQHVFGIAMVGEFLVRAGWDVRDAIGLPQPELVRTVRQGWFAVAALSASSERQLDPLAGTIAAIRAASRHRAIRVMVGGQIFIEQPALALRVGADATASDARMAVRQAERLLARDSVGARAR